MISVAKMLERVSALIDTKDITEWENQFLKSVWGRSKEGKETQRLTGPQIESIEKIFTKHYGD